MADNQKKVTDLTGITTPADANLIPIHDGTGLKNITFANFRNSFPCNQKYDLFHLLSREVTQ